jgi:hypothetical protein
MGKKCCFAALLLFPVLAVSAWAQTAAPAQPMDPDYAAKVKEWTTRPEFMSPLVDHLPASTTVPSPKEVLGDYIGAPKHLTYYADILKYYRTLAAKSPRVKFESIGTTEEGRESAIVFIGSEDSIKNLDTYKKNLARLADPRGLTDAQAHEIEAQTKPIYMIMGGLHSAELGPPEMMMELAYRLVTEDSPIIKKIRDEVVVAIYPTADPDGRDRNIDWYYKYMVDRTDTNGSFEGGVPYWGKYFKHDDNRDINYAGEANRNLLKWYLEWHPPIIHELHESIWFMYTYSGNAPQNTLFDPILWGEMPWFANFEMAQMAKYGMPGVWTHGFMDGWSPGYVGIMAANHNGMMKMYEIMGNAGATTMHRFMPTPNPAVKGAVIGTGDVSKREWFRPSPPYKDVIWSMRNNTNYSETGVLSALQMTSAFPQVVLDDFYVKSRNSIQSGEKEAPYAFVIPSDQADMTKVAFVVKVLRLQGIEVGKATAPIKLKDATYPVGSLVVKCNQPYGRLAKTLLGKQVDPDPTLTTYDDSAWTMGLMSHTTITPIADKDVLSAAVEPLETYTPAGKADKGAGAVAYAVLDHGSPNMITLRYALKDVKVKIAEAGFDAGSVKVPAGSFLVPAGAFEKLKAAAEPMGLDTVALMAEPKVAAHESPLPKVAVYSTWGGTQNVGWVRYTFDQYKVPYDLIFKEQVDKGNLREKYDLIVIPDQVRTAKALVDDIPKGKTPFAYVKSDKFKFLGAYGESEDITGGMGAKGVEEFQEFVNKGGVLVTLGNSSAFPPDYGITPRIDEGTTTPKFYAPGPIIEAEIVKPNDPIFYGYTAKTVPVRWANGPLFRMEPEQDKEDVLMRYPGGDKAVLSGLMNGADEIKGRAAVVKTPVGEGEVVMFTTNPVWRWQNIGEFRMMFNTILNYKSLGMVTQ